MTTTNDSREKQLTKWVASRGEVHYGMSVYPIEAPEFDGFELADEELKEAAVKHAHRFIGRARIYSADGFEVTREPAKMIKLPSGSVIDLPEHVAAVADGVLLVWERHYPGGIAQSLADGS
jgi:hypothetical protein